MIMLFFSQWKNYINPTYSGGLNLCFSFWQNSSNLLSVCLHCFQPFSSHFLLNFSQPGLALLYCSCSCQDNQEHTTLLSNTKVNSPSSLCLAYHHFGIVTFNYFLSLAFTCFWFLLSDCSFLVAFVGSSLPPWLLKFGMLQSSGFNIFSTL